MKVTILDLRTVPILPFALAVIVGVVAALYSDLRSGILLIACAGLFLLGGVAVWRWGARWPALTVVFLFFAVLGSYRATRDLGRDVRASIEELAVHDSTVCVVGRVTGPPVTGQGRCAFVLQPAQLTGDSMSVSCGLMRVRVFADSAHAAALRCGDLLYARGRLSPSSERAQTSVGSMVAMVAQREAAAVHADPTTVIVKPVDGFAVSRLVDGLRGFIVSTFDRRLGPDGAALSKALVLGDRADFSAAFSDKLRLTGLSHVFALSGMNVAFLIAMVWVLLSAVFVPRGIRLCILLGVVLLYMELGRETPSLVRATLMAAVYIIGTLLHRKPNPLNSVAAAAFLEMLWRPLDIVDAGFALSYLAVLGLLGGYGYLRDAFLKLIHRSRPRGALRAVIDLVAASTAAQIGTLPMIGFMFGRLPLLGALGNIVAVPAFGVLLMWAMVLLLTEAIAPILSPVVASSLDAASYFMGTLVDWTASLPLASLSIPPMSPWIAIGLYFATAMLLLGLAFSRRVWIGAALFLAGNVVVWSVVFTHPKPLCTLSFISVGNGDATLISSSTGTNVLVDTGPAYRDWTAADRIVPFLSEQGIRRLDAVILTHPDNDHIGGAAELIRRLPVDHVYVNGDVSASRTSLQLAIVEQSRGIVEQRLSAGQEMRLSDKTLLIVLSPDSALLASAVTDNEKSLVIRVQCGKSSALLTADVDSTVEHLLAAWGSTLDVDLVKVAHHGSKVSTGAEFLTLTSPSECVVSAGRTNIYGHPHPSVMARLAAFGITVHVTAKEGTVVYASDGKRWRHVEMRAARLARLWKLPYG